MYYFEVTKTWGVMAKSEDEMNQLITANPKDHLKKKTVTRTEYFKRDPKTGWGSTIKNQLLGNSSKR